MRKILKKIIHKSANNIFNIPIAKYYSRQKQYTPLPFTEKRKIRTDKLNKILEHASKNISFYKEHYGKQSHPFSGIKNEDDFKDFTPITKKDIIANKKQMLFGQKHLSIRSSGSTGDTSSVAMSTKEAGAKFGIYLSVLGKCGLSQKDKIFQFYPNSYKNKLVDKSSSIAQMFSTFLQNKIAHNLLTNREILFHENAFISKEEAVSFSLKIENAIEKDSSKFALFGRADFLFSLAWHLKKYEIPFPAPKSIITCGTLLTKEMSTKIKELFGAPVYNLYGCSEVSYAALSKADSNEVSTLDAGIYIEIEPIPELKNYHTDAGEIIITDLVNNTMPLIRYRTGDIGTKTGFDSFKILGRKNNIVSTEKKVFTEYDLMELFFAEDMPFFLYEHFGNHNYLHVLKNINLNRNFAKKIKNLGIDNLNIIRKNSIAFADKFTYIKTDAYEKTTLKPESQNTACCICKNYSKDIVFKNDLQAIYLCAKCKLLTAVPLDDRSFTQEIEKEIENSKENLDCHTLKAQKILHIIQNRFIDKNLKDLKILDVGCGNGALFQTAKNHGLTYLGIEPNNKIFNTAKKTFPEAEIFNTDLDNAPINKNSIDVMVLSHVLEHVKNPVRFLALCKTLLKPGGLIYIEVPLDANAVNISKIKKLLKIPAGSPTALNHLTLFTKKSLQNTALKAGFRNLNFKSATRYGNFANIKTALGKNELSLKLRMIFLFFFITRLDIFLKTGYISLTAKKNSKENFK